MNTFLRSFPLLLALGYPTLLTWVYFDLLAESEAGVQQTVYGLGKCLQFAFPLAWYLLVQKQSLRLRGSARASVLAGLAFGGAAAVATGMLFHFVLAPAGLFAGGPQEAIRAKVTGFGIRHAGQYAALAVFYSLIHALLEEYYWRWFVFGQLRRTWRPWSAITVSSLAFAGHHVVVLAQFFGGLSAATIFFTLCVACGGAFWAWLYDRDRSLVAPWLSHMLVDAGIFAVGYSLVREVLQ